MATKKKPSPAQIAARKKFAAMAKSGAFKRKAGSRRKASARVTTKKTRKSTKPPSPAQLRARTKFVAMVRARAGKGTKRRRNVAGDSSVKSPTRTSSDVRSPTRTATSTEAQTSGNVTVTGGAGRGANTRVVIHTAAPRGTKATVGTKKRKNASGVVRFKSEKEYTDWLKSSGHGTRGGKAKAFTAPTRRAPVRKAASRKGKLGLGSWLSRGLKKRRPSWAQKQNPKYTAAEVRAAQNSMMEVGWSGITAHEKAILKWYDGRRTNPKRNGIISRLFKRKPKTARVGYRKTQIRRKKPVAAVGYSRTQRGSSVTARRVGRRNPSPASVFEEFRGKGATTKTQVKAASGTPKVLAKLGQLVELHVRNKKLHFGPGASLAADGRKRLFIVGTKFAKPNPPGEVDFGPIESVVYRSVKPHIDTGVVDYKHKFGEEGGKCPHLIVDDEGYALIEGGSYSLDEDGIIN